MIATAQENIIGAFTRTGFPIERAPDCDHQALLRTWLRKACDFAWRLTIQRVGCYQLGRILEADEAWELFVDAVRSAVANRDDPGPATLEIDARAVAIGAITRCDPAEVRDLVEAMAEALPIHGD